MTLMAAGAAADVLSLGVRDRQGRVLVDAADPEGSLNRFLRGRGLVIGAIPSSSTALPLSSNFAVRAQRLGSSSSEGLSVSAWVKRGNGGVPAVQELPLSVLLVGGARSAGGRLDTALGALTGIWRAAGVEILDPARLEVAGPELVTVDPALGSDSPMVGEVLRLSERAPGTLALVVVSDLALAGMKDFTLFALSGSIPVPPTAGTPRSGVVVNAAFLNNDPGWAGQVIAHEIGHALGLYHTSERALVGGQAIHDQLDDSPGCPASADRDGDGALEGSECGAYDASNLMFWATVRGATRLTPGQAEQARRSALTR